ncbi:MAG: FHA domain-containing protein [Acidobacteriia bacterium]|nr:FHA domain-containing protein [Terriglobia bacterium]
MDTKPSREVYGVGELTLDIGLHLLTRAGEVVPLPPKTFELFAELVRRAPGAVRRQELVDGVWPNEIVNDEALTQRVLLLRRALGDDPKKPQYIASVPRWGYRIVAPVRRVPATERPSCEEASRFVVLHGDRLIALPEGETVIGRDTEAGVSIDSLRISRRHARIAISGGRATLEDLGSKNGTQLNGTPITGPTELSDGDKIGIGPEVLVFSVRDRMGTTLTDSP